VIAVERSIKPDYSTPFTTDFFQLRGEVRHMIGKTEIDIVRLQWA
jgi:hypothetical protein